MIDEKLLQLIEEVRSKPALFDKSQSNYKNNVVKSKYWQDIAQKIGLKGNFFIE